MIYVRMKCCPLGKGNYGENECIDFGCCGEAFVLFSLCCRHSKVRNKVNWIRLVSIPLYKFWCWHWWCGIFYTKHYNTLFIARQKYVVYICVFKSFPMRHLSCNFHSSFRKKPPTTGGSCALYALLTYRLLYYGTVYTISSCFNLFFLSNFVNIFFFICN